EERHQFRVPVAAPDVSPSPHQFALVRAVRRHDPEIGIAPVRLRRRYEDVSPRTHDPRGFPRGPAVVIDMLEDVEQGDDIETVVPERLPAGVAADEGGALPHRLLPPRLDV